jgi:iron complex transport system substrate-binding protein
MRQLHSRLSVFLQIFTLAACIASCRPSSSEMNTERMPIETSGKRSIRYAQGFQIIEMESYRLLSIHNPIEGDTARYILLNQGESIPPDLPEAPILRIPLQRVAVSSPFWVAALERLEALDFLFAIESGMNLYSSPAQKRMNEGLTIRIDRVTGSKDFSPEKLPDIILSTIPTVRETARPSQEITDTGVPVIYTSYDTETTPLGQAEWIKLAGALTGRQSFSDHQFAFVEHGYLSLAKRVNEKAQKLPAVLAGELYNRHQWQIPGGKSLTARLLDDSGGSYLPANDTSTGSIVMDDDTFSRLLSTADVWLSDSGVGSARELTLQAAPQPGRTKRIYSPTNRIALNGSNDYIESAPLRPDLLMADYVHILHPDLLPHHMLYYYKQMK